MTARHTRFLSLAVAGVVAALAASCGGGGSPSTPSTPTPTAQPTPTPPTGGGGVGSTSCPLGSGSVSAQCSKSSGRLVDAIFAAQDLAAGPIARVALPARISSGTHGCWAPAEALQRA